MSFGPHSATVVRRGWNGTTRDRHNNPVLSTLSTFTIVGCFLQQRTSEERLDARDTTVTTWVLFIPPLGAGQAIGPEDHVRISAASARVDPDPGQTFATFELDGNPDLLDHITGVLHHGELILRRVRL